MSLQYQTSYFGQEDSSTVNDIYVEKSNLENGVNGHAPPPGTSEEGTDMDEDKIDQHGDVRVEDHGERKSDSEVLADGDVDPVASKMEE